MKKRYRKQSWAVFGILTIAMVFMMISFFMSTLNRDEEEKEDSLRATAQLIGSSVTDSFLKPITVAKVMSEDVNLKKNLKIAGKSPEKVEDAIADYLTSLREGFGYKMLFAVCNDSGAYYTTEGITSYIDKDYTGNSEWYGDFLDADKEMNLDVDIEDSTGWELSVFVNQMVKDEDNNFLGVCGTAVEMTQLQSLLENYERIYNVRIDLTDEKGLIQIDTDENKINIDYVSLPDTDLISDGEVYYEKSGSGDRIITYLKELDLYLVVADTQNEVNIVLSYVGIPLACLLAGLLTSIVYIAMAAHFNKKTKENAK